MKSWRFAAFGLAIALAGIALAWHWHSTHVESAAQAARDEPVVVEVAPPPPVAEFHRDVKPIFDRRCLVCHGCYDAPCQLKLDSAEGVMRGATTAKVYDATRLQEADTTRLFVDARDVSGWRQKGFFSVLDKGEPNPAGAGATPGAASGTTPGTTPETGFETNAGKNPATNLDDSVLYQMLALKEQHPQPETLPKSIDLSLGRDEFCPTRENFADYARERPLEGMPFALPGLSGDELATVKRWLEGGAKFDAPKPVSALALQRVADWERFLNRDDLKARLMSRYLYEHLFLADLHFDDGTSREFFKLVRSRTPPGVPVDLIATRRPYDDPKIPRVYYRLQPQRTTVIAKTHLPYRLDARRMSRFEQLFLQVNYSVPSLPSYAPEVSANPFVAFEAIPVQSRYRFLLDEGRFFIDTFIKGPVCRGQIALNAIHDRFWVMFANPDREAMVDAQFLAAQSAHLRLPNELPGELKAPERAAQWHRYADQQADYLAAKQTFLREKFGSPQDVTLDLIWNGGGSNENAALTVFRHFDSASVLPGLVGEVPKTAWLIDYPMFERIYYLLVAGFDVYGDGGHQLVTRLYMDFLRMEGEANFLHFLPRARRERERNSWYQGIGAKARESVYRKVATDQRDPGIDYKSNDSKREFFDLLKAHLGPALSQRYAMTDVGPITDVGLVASAREALDDIAQLRGKAVSRLPEVVLLRVIVRGDADRLFTLLHDVDHANVAMLFLEKARRRPQFDTVTLVPGIVGAYPNAFWVVGETELPQLARQLAAVDGPKSYAAVAQRYAVARTNPRFWQESDWITNTYRNLEPIEWGVLDYNRYER